MSGPIQRGHANTQQRVVVRVDAGQVADAAEVAVDAEAIELRSDLVHELSPLAVVSSSVGVERALLRTPWRWGPRSLMQVLMLETLRG